MKLGPLLVTCCPPGPLSGVLPHLLGPCCFSLDSEAPGNLDTAVLPAPDQEALVLGVDDKAGFLAGILEVNISATRAAAGRDRPCTETQNPPGHLSQCEEEQGDWHSKI